jgi:hypothetical protein
LLAKLRQTWEASLVSAFEHTRASVSASRNVSRRSSSSPSPDAYSAAGLRDEKPVANEPVFTPKGLQSDKGRLLLSALAADTGSRCSAIDDPGGRDRATETRLVPPSVGPQAFALGQTKLPFVDQPPALTCFGKEGTSAAPQPSSSEVGPPQPPPMADARHVPAGLVLMPCAGSSVGSYPPQPRVQEL